MKIKVFNRNTIQRIRVNVPCIAISISDSKKKLPPLDNLESKATCKGVLRQIFFDTENIEHPNAFTQKQAKEILTFVKKHINHIQLILCQCDMGISRSAGVAAALSVILNRNVGKFFKKPYNPNELVYKTILKVEHKADIIPEEKE